MPIRGGRPPAPLPTRDAGGGGAGKGGRGAGPPAGGQLPSNAYGTHILGSAVPKATVDKSAKGTALPLCVRMSLTADQKCPMAKCSYSHERLLTHEEKVACIYTPTPSLPDSVAGLKE